MHPAPGHELEGLLDELALPEGVHDRRRRPQLEAEGAGEHQVVGDAVELGENDPQVLRTAGHLEAEHALDRQGGGDLVVDAREPVHPRQQVGDLAEVPLLDQLLVAPVHVADDRLRPDDPLPVDTDEHPQHPMCGGVLGADVEDHLLGVEAPRAGKVGNPGEVLGDRAHQARPLIAGGLRRLPLPRPSPPARPCTGGWPA